MAPKKSYNERDIEYWKMQTEMNTVTGKVAFEYITDDLKTRIMHKMSQLLCDGQLKQNIGIYVNHPMEIKE